jgi:formylglycine-generating enzyme required for sulfatase activity
MKKISKIMLNCWFLAICSLQLHANNIQVSNVVLTGQNTASQFTFVQFDIAWENSWRVATGPSNWDAAWVFIKFRVGDGPWLHAFLNESGHTAGTGTTATITPGLLNTANAFNATTNPAMGVFVHRSTNGIGNFINNGLKLRWNYGANSIENADVVEVKVFAVEMVYVPSGSFQVGDGNTTNIQGHLRNGSTNEPFMISSEDALTLGGTANGNLANNNGTGMVTVGDFNNATTQTLPAAFPKGFNAFYCMKYEVTQQQWVDFFNVLDNNQKINRDITDAIGKNSDAIIFRNNISWTSGDATLNGGTHGDIACNFISWIDGAAFADWASLRPMTELEYEKACRGTLNPVTNEYAWGTTSITGATGISNSGAYNEVASNIGANAVLGNNANVRGPLRVGSFATVSSTREQAGASYYGIMDLSGNLWERTVSLGNATGRNFTARIHGNGLLTNDGFCDITTWPGFTWDKVTLATGAGLRGGSWLNGSTNLHISNRNVANRNHLVRNNEYGFRAVRSVP